ncbi:Alpha/Beta hydrolase protein [Flammula alnicola]|nr:Alpha/Beta hydrolase protein [Flammula alnicola]
MNADDSHGRVGLADRLDALFNLLSNSPRNSQDSSRSSLDSPTHYRQDSMRRVPKPTAPVLRWLSNSNSTHQPALDEAMNTPLPTRPQPARLPPSFRASHMVIHPPPFFDNLTRSTLPTSSLSPPLRVENSPAPSLDATIARPPPIVLTHVPPTRSSIDTLRDVQGSATTSASSSRWWFQSDFFSSQDDGPSIAPKEEIKKKYLSPKNPVVFCHGLLGFDSVTIGPAIAPFEVTHWRGIKEVLEENGTEVLITRVPATSSPVDRAKVLEQKISSVYPGRSVHLIGHSMGGLDCRYLTTHLTDRKFKVLSITTIATPHHGSSFADYFLSTVGRTRMPSVLSLLDLLPNGGGDGKAFESLTVDSMRKFNEDCPDVEGVRYFSWGAVYEPGLIDTWKWPHSVILEKEGPNDGLVSVESSKWGTYLGTLSQVNHLDLVGWVNTARYKWAEMMGKEIKFRPATFYLGIADMLAREVEGQGSEEGIEGSQVGEGVVLEGSDGAAVGNHERARMVDSLSAAGADVQEAGTRTKKLSGVDSPGERIAEDDGEATPMQTTPKLTSLSKPQVKQHAAESRKGSGKGEVDLDTDSSRTRRLAPSSSSSSSTSSPPPPSSK